MNTSNSFLKMMEEDERMFPPPPEIEENVLGSLGILTIMGHALELYIPKVFEMFIATLGGTLNEIDKIPTTETPTGAPGDEHEDLPPGMAGHPPA
ncbi:MAG: hypothetical protein EPO28_00695 [Saprospiraceae bacterium]|nr:MAG: hypothetical protein EPO28_00695 [Saprospiraceae bacterium]